MGLPNAAVPMMRALLLLVFLLFLSSGTTVLAESKTVSTSSAEASVPPSMVEEDLGHKVVVVPDDAAAGDTYSSSFSSSSSSSDSDDDGDSDIHSKDGEEESDDDEADDDEGEVAKVVDKNGEGGAMPPAVVVVNSDGDGSSRDRNEKADANLMTGSGQGLDGTAPSPLPLDCTALLHEQTAVCEQSSQAMLREWNEQRAVVERQHAAALETCVADRTAAEAKLVEQRQKSVRLLQERIQALQLHSEKIQSQLERTKQDLFDARRENHILTEQVTEWQDAWWNVPEQYRKATTFIEEHWQYGKAQLQRMWRIVEPYWTVVENALRAACHAASRVWNKSIVPHWEHSVKPLLVRLGLWLSHHAREAWIEGRLLVHVCGVHLRSGAAKAYEATYPYREKLWQILQPHTDDVVARFAVGYQSVLHATSAAALAAENSAAGRAFRGAEHVCRTKIAAATDAALRRYSNGTDQVSSSSSSSSALATAWAVTALQGLQRAAQPADEGGVPGEWILFAVTLWFLIAVPRTVRWLASPRKTRKEEEQAPPSHPATNGVAVANGSSATHGSNGSTADQSNGSNGTSDGHHPQPHPQRRTLI